MRASVTVAARGWAALAVAQAGRALRRDRRAVTAIEYALIAGIMVTALVLSVPAIGPELSTIFNSVSSHL